MENIKSRWQLMEILTKNIGNKHAGVIFWYSPISKSIEYNKIWSEDINVINEWLKFKYLAKDSLKLTCATFVCEGGNYYNCIDKSSDWSDFVMEMEP